MRQLLSVFIFVVWSFFVTVFLLVIAQDDPAITVPDSLRDVKQCNVGVPSLLCDSYHMLNSAEGGRNGALQIHSRLAHLRLATACACGEMCRASGAHGFTISVVVLRRMQNYFPIVSESAAVNFARDLRQRFAQRAQCADDALIVLFAEDAVTFASLGDLISQKLSPEIVDAIAREAQQYFFKKDFTRGILYMIHEYGKYLLALNVDENLLFSTSNSIEFGGVIGSNLMNERPNKDYTATFVPQLGSEVYLDEFQWPWWPAWPWTAFPRRWASDPALRWLRVLLLILFICTLIALIGGFLFATRRLCVNFALNRRRAYTIGRLQHVKTTNAPAQNGR